MAVEVFTRKSIQLTKVPTITVQKKGVMGLNFSAYEMLRGLNKETDGKLPVHLLYDKEEQIVGLRVTDSDDPNAYLVRRQKISPSFLVAGRAFFNHYGVELGVTRRYKARIYDDGDGDYIGFSLREESRIVSRR